jgi:hypothetical protein
MPISQRFAAARSGSASVCAVPRVGHQWRKNVLTVGTKFPTTDPAARHWYMLCTTRQPAITFARGNGATADDCIDSAAGRMHVRSPPGGSGAAQGGVRSVRRASDPDPVAAGSGEFVGAGKRMLFAGARRSLSGLWSGAACMADAATPRGGPQRGGVVSGADLIQYAVRARRRYRSAALSAERTMPLRSGRCPRHTLTW